MCSTKDNKKLLATVGPSSLHKDIIAKMDEAGVDIFRINLSHTKVSDLERVVSQLKKWTKRAICIDTEGAQLRTGKFVANGVKIEDNQIVSFVASSCLGNNRVIPLYPVLPSSTLQIGDILWIDFGSVRVHIIEVRGNRVRGRVISGGYIGSNKGVAIDRHLQLPPLTPKDMHILGVCKRLHLKHFALSFAANGGDIKKLRKLFPYAINVIAKIESQSGLKNLQPICRESDAILIDRGDLSRELPIQTIGLAQRYILKKARHNNTPVYVATNLLESMLEKPKPTRAEINDITSTVLDGASGLVLAAETAVGQYPVESVRMTVAILKEIQEYVKNKNKWVEDSHFNYPYRYLIPPHGGKLVQNFADPQIKAKLAKLPTLQIDNNILSDVINIAEGVFSPLKGFMDYKEITSVLDDNRMPGGIVWTLPVILQQEAKTARELPPKGTVKLSIGDKCYAVMNISEVKKINLRLVAKKWFGTTSLRHPGVSRLLGGGEYIIGGEVFLVEHPGFTVSSYEMSPAQTRRYFAEQGWQKIVGFHTRNVIHRGHEFIQKKALSRVNGDALFLSPVVGIKKKGDFSAEAVIKSYETMMQNKFYSPHPVLLCPLNTYPRYSGPREAVFTAICRKNYGCTHFIVGRDHTGVKDFYSGANSAAIFKKIGDIGIEPIIFDEAYYCKQCKSVVSNCRHLSDQKVSISGTAVRKYLQKGRVPGYIMRKEISEGIIRMLKQSEKIFEG